MKNMFKTFGLHIGVFSVIVLSFGIAYAAWDSVVTTGTQLSSSSWNILVDKVKTIDSSLSFDNGNVGIGTTNPGTKLELSGSDTAGSLLRLKNDNSHYTEVVKRSASHANPHAFSVYNNDGANWHHGITISGVGNVGMGTEAPQAKLHVAQSGNQPSVYAVTSGSNYGLHGESSQNYGVYGKTNSASYGGVLGYAANASTYGILGYANRYSLYGNGDIHVGGGIYLNTVPTSGTVHLCRDSTGYITYCSSDKRLKRNIQALHENSANIISKLKPVSFNWKEDGRSDVGFIAQDVQNVIPESVTINPNDDYLTFNTTPIVAHLVKAFQDMQQQMKEKDIEIQNLQQELNILKNK